MKCPNCKTENKADAIYCSDCSCLLKPKNMKAKKEKEHIIFISHAEQDKKIVSAFSELIDMILCTQNVGYKIFWSSDDGCSIGCGEVPYDAITDNINKSNNVFCLLTNNSFDRPWVMYEIGYAKGKSKTKQLMPIVIGIEDKNKLNNKPYSYFSMKQCDKKNMEEIMIRLLKNIHNKTDIGNELVLKKSFSPHITTFLKKVKKELIKINIMI